MEKFRTIKKQASDEFVEKKSRFIGHISPVDSVEQAMEFVSEIKTQHRQATHNCWAYLMQDGLNMRYSDDGEPQGTAGIPILEVLKKEEILNTAVVVTRYYGGIMLGAGGLVRAYSAGAKLAVDAGEPITMAACDIIDFSVPYNLYDLILSKTEDFPMVPLSTEYSDNIYLKLRIRKDYTNNLEKILTEVSSGGISPNFIGEEFAPIE